MPEYWNSEVMKDKGYVIEEFRDLGIKELV